MTPWVTRLIIANVVVYIMTMAAPGLTTTFMLVPALIFVRPWTLVTYMFLHGGLWHILFNMLGLFFFGPRLEINLGGKKFLWLYFISGITGGLLSFVFTPYTGIIGASGAIFGVFMGFAYYWPRERIYVWGILPIEARWLVAIMTVLSLFGGIGIAEPGIAHFAHLGGFLGGFLYLKFLDKTSRAARFQKQMAVPPGKSSDPERWAKIQRENLHEVNRAEYDRIMAKIKASGVDSLEPNERAFLDRFSQL
jgi:membrane associated rhomboid family serine protease